MQIFENDLPASLETELNNKPYHFFKQNTKDEYTHSHLIDHKKTKPLGLLLIKQV